MKGLADRIGCTEGQAYTLLITAALSALLAFGGLPPALRLSNVGTQTAAVAPPAPGSTEQAPPTFIAPPPPQAPPPAPPFVSAPTLPSFELPSPSLDTSGGTGFGGSPDSGSFGSGADPSSGGFDEGSGGGEQLSFGSGEPGGMVTVSEASYARAVGGPVGTVGVPPDGVPVGTRAGNEDARAYLRLTGDGTQLVLKVHPAASSNVFPEQAAILACPVVDPAWKLERGSALSAAPEIDRESCIEGTAGNDGTWTFELALLGDVTESGVALTAEVQPGQTFQVTFQTPVAPEGQPAVVPSSGAQPQKAGVLP